MLNVYQSNEMERLVDALVDELRIPLSSPTMPEWIGVQTQGLGTWLGMMVSRRLGIWANVYQPYPRALIERIFGLVLGDDCPDTTRFEPAALTWSVMGLLPKLINRPEFGILQTYLTDDSTGLKRFQLSRRIAEAFDRYAVYRPDWVLSWETGKGGSPVPPENQWQPILWQALVAQLGSSHVAAAADAYLKGVAAAGCRSRDLPPRIALFGISTLPPLYLSVLSALPDDIAVNLFILNPSREYWAHIRSRKEFLRESNRRSADADEIEESLFQEVGHPLLASLGRVGRDFQYVLEGTTNYIEPAGDLFTDPLVGGNDSLLHQLQSDMLHLDVTHRLACPGEVSPEDDSVTIHNCHSPMREVQVLHDHLTDLFQREPMIAPHDVIVMVPDISAYGPVVATVFGREGSETAIAFTLSDQGPAGESPVVQAFLQILRLAAGRLAITEVLDLLSADPVRERFGIAVGDMPLVRHWLLESGVRWGIDADHRAAFGQPPLYANTWRFGLDRLLLGVTMPDKHPRLFMGILPHPGIEGKETELLGNVAAFCETLFGAVRRLNVSQSVPEWERTLAETLSALVAVTTENTYQHRMVLDSMAALARNAEAAAGKSLSAAERVSLTVIQQAIADLFKERPSVRGFLSGGVTFCNLLPMRSIPFKVVCLLGMNDSDYPRSRPPAGFDLIGSHPRSGDRSVRNDDRYLFLEALLSARQRFMVFYVGQAIADHAVMPPSVVVGELLDAIEEGYRLPSSPAAPGNSDLRRRLVTRHPLHPFNPAYFDGNTPALFSYAADYLEGARALIGGKRERPPFFTVPLPEPADGIETISLSDLVEFFKMPVDFLLKRRLGIVFEKAIADIDSREPIRLDGLDRFQSGEMLLQNGIAGQIIPEMMPLLQAGGKFPPESIGEFEAKRLEAEVSPLCSMATFEMTREAPLSPLTVALEIDSVLITGLIDALWPSARIVSTYGKLTERRKLSLWISHLVLNSVNQSRIPRRSILICMGKSGAERYELRPVEKEAMRLLSDLVSLYRLGMTRPLPFFPAAAYAYAKAWKGESEERKSAPALKAARKIWSGGGQQAPGEGEGPGIRYGFGNLDPLVSDPLGEEGAFPDLALRVWGPLLEAEIAGENGERKGGKP